MNHLISDTQIYEQSFYPFNDTTILLPHGVRTYIDYCSDEFNKLTIEGKLCNLGFALTRDLNLYDAIKQDINKHLADPHYHNYETIAKQSLCWYIDFLRETDTSSTEILLEQHSGFTLIALVNLLIEEILLRYHEMPDTKPHEYIVHFTSIPVDYPAIIERFHVKCTNASQLCLNYLLTSQETLSKASIDKDYILYLNRWKKLLPKLSGYDLYFSYNMIFPGDEKYIEAYNDARKEKPNNQLILNIPPEPWSGNILNSKLVLLSLNPGYVEHLNKSLANMFKPQMAEAIMEDKRIVLAMNGHQFDYYEPTRILGEYYWRKNITPLGIAIYGKQEKDKIFTQVSLCQYLAYTSLTSPAIKDLLPSQKFTKMVLLYLASSAKDVKFLILRAASQWKALMGEGLWNYLRETNRLLLSEHYRSQCLSEKNIGTENYKIITEHLKNN